MEKKNRIPISILKNWSQRSRGEKTFTFDKTRLFLQKEFTSKLKGLVRSLYIYTIHQEACRKLTAIICLRTNPRDLWCLRLEGLDRKSSYVDLK